MEYTDERTHLEPGDEGWVQMVDGGGTVHVSWDAEVHDFRPSSGLGLIPGLDRWEWL
jgi:hypothetical protein